MSTQNIRQIKVYKSKNAGAINITITPGSRFILKSVYVHAASSITDVTTITLKDAEDTAYDTILYKSSGAFTDQVFIPSPDTCGATLATNLTNVTANPPVLNADTIVIANPNIGNVVLGVKVIYEIF